MWSGPLHSLSRVSLDDLDDYGQALWHTLGLPSGAKSIRPGDSAQTTVRARACMRSHFHLPSDRATSQPTRSAGPRWLIHHTCTVATIHCRIACNHNSWTPPAQLAEQQAHSLGVDWSRRPTSLAAPWFANAVSRIVVRSVVRYRSQETSRNEASGAHRYARSECICAFVSGSHSLLTAGSPAPLVLHLMSLPRDPRGTQASACLLLYLGA